MAPTLRRRTIQFQNFENNFDYLRFLSEKKKKRWNAACIRRTTFKEYELEQKIDLEIKMREGTTKLLAACKHPIQSLEAAKSLLTSNERMTAYMAKLQQRKAAEKRAREEATPSLRVSGCNARVAVSDIRMPLIWKDSDHFKNKGDYRRFAVFCLLKIGTEIYDTVMINNVDRSMTDISFEDVVVFNRVPPNFEFRLEVYSHVLHDDLSIASTPRKIKKKISNSISRTIGRKLAASLKEELTSIDIGPKFDLVAHATLRLSDSSDDIHTHDLILENAENPHHQLPLFGHFCCRLAVQPDCATEECASGHLGLVQRVGNVGGCRRMWCTLRNFRLSFWAKCEDSQHSPPVLSIPVDKETVCLPEKSSIRPHCFKIVNRSEGKMVEHVLSADTDLQCAEWTARLSQHARDHELWAHAAEAPMEIPSPAPVRTPFCLRSRQGSLYDETPLRDSPPSSLGTGVLHESNHRLSPPCVRSRSSSTSSAASSAGGGRRGFFAFRKPDKDYPFC
ncbi:rhotekin-2-like isoform X2 [Centruroides vittatus]|uniref:rhotekin-2-like isoform X2 n=1 Tax=Centruroides vittatus TaxID=120091 RepID=UPI00350F3548